MLITDPAFAAGVVSGKARLPGTLRGDGSSVVRVDYLPTEAKVVRDEWFYTSGDDRVFPRGLPVGRVTVSERGRDFRDVKLAPSGLDRGFEEVLVVIDGIHELLPEGGSGVEATNESSQLLPAPASTGTDLPAIAPDPTAPGSQAMRTDADRLLDRYRKIGEAQGHKFGAGGAPNFNAPVTAPNAAGAPAAPNSKPGAVAVPPGQ
jgi:rod shape-determining protein MreC